MAIVALVIAALASTACAGMRDSRMNVALHRHLERVSSPKIGQVEIEFFTQRLDHFNPQDSRTFGQQYQVNSQYAAQDGPIFLLLGGEGPASPSWLEYATAMMTYAETYNATAIQLEHRFYGKSQPFEDSATENLRYLSSEQALADAAAFVSWFKKSRGLEDSKVVVFGGSYSGALSAFFRAKYPNIVHASVATSAPVEAELDFFQYHEVVTASLKTSTQGESCTDAFSAATQKVESMLLTTASREQLIEDFNICNTSDLSQMLDQQWLMSALVSNIDEIVQYNLETPGSTVQTMCDVMTGGSDAYAMYAKLQQQLTYGNCIDASYWNYVADMRNTSLDSDVAPTARPWVYQTCAEFSYFQTSDSAKQVFGDMFPLPLWERQCTDIYLMPAVPNVNWTNQEYGGKNMTGTRILFVNGSIDPWHALSVLNSTNPDMPSIMIQGTAHCANMQPAHDSDLKSLTNARIEISKQIGTWLLE